MNKVLSTLLSASISGTLLSVLLLLLKPLIRNRVSKAFSYYIWILVLLRLVLPFGYTIDLSGIPQFFANADAQSYTTSAGAVRNASDRMPNAAGKTEQQSSDNPTNSETEGLPTARPAADSGLDFWELLKANLFYIWLAGAIVSLCWYATAYIVFSRKILHSFTAPHEEDLAVFQK